MTVLHVNTMYLLLILLYENVTRRRSHFQNDRFFSIDTSCHAWLLKINFPATVSRISTLPYSCGSTSFDFIEFKMTQGKPINIPTKGAEKEKG